MKRELTLERTENILTDDVAYVETDDSAYVEDRIRPQLKDQYYLHLVDLLRALQNVATHDRLRILDYGAGFSPYRTFFPASDYRRADIAANQFKGQERALEYVIADDGTISEKSGFFDLVLSTQVLEHVVDPEVYLRECLRLLKPGGELALSTHGLYEEHGCPNDFRRWTAEGLKRDLSNAGFEVRSVLKLTTGPRAMMFLLERHLETTFLSRANIIGFAYWVARSVFRTARGGLHRMMDRQFSNHCAVESSLLGHSTYVALLARAHRPG